MRVARTSQGEPARPTCRYRLRDWTNAWASFVSDIGKHMMSGLFNERHKFEDFISGWSV